MTVSQLIQALVEKAPNARVMFLGPSTSGGDMVEVRDALTSEDDDGLFVELTEN